MVSTSEIATDSDVKNLKRKMAIILNDRDTDTIRAD